MTTNFPTMNTITQAAATSGLAVYRVRQLCQSGRIKSIRCGRRILVNMDSLAAYLNEGDAVQPALRLAVSAGQMRAKVWRRQNGTEKNVQP